MSALIDQHGNPLVAKQVTEGAFREGPYFLPVTGGWLSAAAGRNWNWWQLGYDVERPGRSAMVEACVTAYSQTIAMCPGDHWRATANGGRERVTNSALTRILRKPNGYQTISDFLLNATDSLYRTGNTYALALRNVRFEIAELHLMSDAQIRVAETGELFYRLSGNEIIETRLDYEQLIVPSRDVLHIKLHTDGELTGESPLMAAAPAMAAGSAMMQQQIAFYLNQARPSFGLTTDLPLNPEQVEQIRTAWQAQSQGLNAGGTPILAHGMKPVKFSSTAEEGQLADIMKLSDQQIALVFRVPLQILGIGGTPYASTELLMQSWIASGLGFALNHIEEAFGLLFGLRGQPDEYLEFNTDALLRSAFKDRIEALARGVQGGIYAPNEARSEFELPAKEFGDEPRVQEQVVPLSFGAKKEPTAPTPPVAPTPDKPEEDSADADDADETRQWLARSLLTAADAHDRLPA